jgi:hypothetical protein
MRTQLLDNTVTALTESAQRQIKPRGPTVRTRLIIEVSLKLEFEFEADGDSSLTGGCVALRAYRI